MKSIILTNTILSIAALIEICIAILYFYRTNFKAKYRSIDYLRTTDKLLYASDAKLGMFCIFTIDFLAVVYNLIRIADNWHPYYSEFITSTVLVYYAAIFLLSHKCRILHASK